MRVALFVLLFANIAFFAWGAWIDTPSRAAAAPAASGLKQLVLASEADAKSKNGTQHSADGGAGAATAASNVPRCVSVGPFDSEELSDAALAVLRQRGYEPRRRSEEGERWDGYWVYIGNLKSDLEEARVMRTLIQAQLSDARIMPISPEGRRISVGVFSERVRAERRARVLQRLNLEAQIGERRTPGTIYWLDLEPHAGEADFSTAGLLPSDMPGTPLQARPCPTGP